MSFHLLYLQNIYIMFSEAFLRSLISVVNSHNHVFQSCFAGHGSCSVLRGECCHLRLSSWGRVLFYEKVMYLVPLQ